MAPPFPFSQGEHKDGYHRILRASHVIKGAAANLMCQQLRQTATDLEKSAAIAHSAADKITDDMKHDVEKCYEDLASAVEKYNEYLDSIDV